MARDGVREGLTALLEAAAARAPVNSLAVVRPDADDHAVVTGANALGVMAYRVATVAPMKSGDLKSAERALVEKALLDARYNKSHAAKLLGVTRAQLYAKLRRHGLD